MHEFRGIGLHQLHAGAQGVGHVHHVHVYVRRHGAGEAAVPDRLVVDLHGVVGRAAAGQRDVRNQTRETHRAGIDAEARVVVVAHQLARDLAHAVHGRRTHHRILRRLVLGRRGAERTDRRGGEHGALAVAGHLQRVGQRTDVDLPGQLGVLLTHGRQQRHEVENGVDAVSRHDRSHGRNVECVEHFERTLLGQRRTFAHVGGDDVGIAVDLAQIGRQLRTDLTACAYD